VVCPNELLVIQLSYLSVLLAPDAIENCDCTAAEFTVGNQCNLPSLKAPVASCSSFRGLLLLAVSLADHLQGDLGMEAFKWVVVVVAVVVKTAA
jgi:hypothetical protein